MPVRMLIKEIMWEYNCSRRGAKKLIRLYKEEGKYLELCNIVKYKRNTPCFDKEEFI